MAKQSLSLRQAYPEGVIPIYKIPHKLTRKPRSMTRKRKRRRNIIEYGAGVALVKIYPINRSDGYSQFTVAWKEGGKRRTRTFASEDDARLIARQTSIRLENGASAIDEMIRRDMELLKYCEELAKQHGVSISAAMEEWASARKLAGDTALTEALRFFQANRRDIYPNKPVREVAEEFLTSRKARGVMDAYIQRSTD